jgi:hypothetical protein
VLDITTFTLSPVAAYFCIPSASVRVNVTDPYETTGNTTVLYILNIIFLDNKHKTKDYGAEGSKHFPNLSALNLLNMPSCKSFVTYFSRNTTKVALLVL